jgi:alkylated DNA nucleotide flippase Atl1
LGNLTLTGYNPELSNNSFAIKRQLLRDSNLELNRPIAQTEHWGPSEIMERADDLAERASLIWPGPDVAVREQALGRDWQLLHEALAALPAGGWTTYSDLAELVGSHPVPVGVHIANTPHLLNGHRAMSIDGRISPAFRWSDPDDDRDPIVVLTDEGVHFVDGRADPSQRITAPELAMLVGLGDQRDELTVPTAFVEDPAQLDAEYARFLEQLAQRHPPAVAGAVTRLLDSWREVGGTLTFGSASQTTSCFPMIRGRGEASIWPLSIYPGSTVEVVFQYLKTRPPFDDPALRGELRNRLNSADEIEIPLAKLELRPSFPIDALADGGTWSVVEETLRWFVGVVRESPAYMPTEHELVPADGSAHGADV